MSHIVAIQSTYQTVEIGLFDGTQCLHETILDKKDSSAQLIPTLSALCGAQKWHIKDVAYYIVNQGPGPFTTLRTVIATVNGLSFATKTPIVGINALEAVLMENDPDNSQTTLALLNAFGGEVYYGLRYVGDTEIKIGVDILENIYATIQTDTLCVVGSAAASSAAMLHEMYGNKVTINTECTHASLKTISTMGLKQIRGGYQNTHHLMPLYLKNME